MKHLTLTNKNAILFSLIQNEIAQNQDPQSPRNNMVWKALKEIP